jgi:hypothetical protein
MAQAVQSRSSTSAPDGESVAAGTCPKRDPDRPFVDAFGGSESRLQPQQFAWTVLETRILGTAVAEMTRVADCDNHGVKSGLGTGRTG